MSWLNIIFNNRAKQIIAECAIEGLKRLIDKDGNGKISEEEMKYALRAYKRCLKWLRKKL